MTNSKNIPKRRFKEFELLNGWREQKLGLIAKYRRGSFPQPYGKKEWYDGPGAMPFVQVIDVSNNLRLVEDTKQKISKIAQNKSVFVPKSTVIVTLQGSIGRVAVTQYDSYVDRTLLIFENYNVKINPLFWAYTIQNKFDEESKRAPGGTIKTITKEALSNFDILLPSISEQESVGEFFQTIDSLITLHQHKLDKLKNLKKSYLAELFPAVGERVPKRRFPGFEGEWERRKVSELFKITRGYVLAATRTESNKSKTTPYPVYSSQTKDKGLMGFYSKYLYEDAITWTTDGANAGEVNYREGKFYCTNVCGVLLSKEVQADPMIAEAINNIAKKYVSYVGNPKLMNNVMADIEISIPQTSSEREKISQFFTDIDKRISLQQEKLDKLKDLKKAYLNELFV